MNIILLIIVGYVVWDFASDHYQRRVPRNNREKAAIQAELLQVRRYLHIVATQKAPKTSRQYWKAYTAIWNEQPSYNLSDVLDLTEWYQANNPHLI